MAFLGRGSDDSLRRSLWRWRISASLLLFILVWIFYGGISDWFEGVAPHIARVEITGIIEENREQEQNILQLAENDSVKAVILYLNTPGGTVVGGESLYEAVRTVRQHKPVAVVMGDMATSAGYMIALAGDYVVARNGTLTGSIGVLLQSAEITEMARKVGVQLDSVKSAPLKGSPSPFERMTPAARASMQGVVDSFYSFFVNLVSKERKIPLAEAQKLADGRVFTGQQALQVKLIDAIGGEEKALEWLHSVKKVPESLAIRDVSLQVEPSRLEEWLHNLTGRAEFAPLARISLQGLVSIW